MENHFIEYYYIIDKIKEKYSYIRKMEEAMYSLGSITYDKVAGSNGEGRDTSYYIGEIDEAKKDIVELKKERARLREQHEQEISKLKSRKFQSVLRMTYLDEMRIELVADTLGMSVSNCKKVKTKAEHIFCIVNDLKIGSK